MLASAPRRIGYAQLHSLRRTPQPATGPYNVRGLHQRKNRIFTRSTLGSSPAMRFPACLKASRPVFALGVLISKPQGVDTVLPETSGKRLKRLGDTRELALASSFPPEYGHELRSRLDLVGIRRQVLENGYQTDISARLTPLVYPDPRAWLPVTPAIYPAALSWDIVLRAPLRRLRLLPMRPLLFRKLHGDALCTRSQPYIHATALTPGRHEPGQRAQYREEEH